MRKSKLESVLEHMVNGEMDLANDLLHEHLVESARNIYEELSKEDDLVEVELDLDESEDDIDEAYDISDSSDDFEDDISSIEDEIETEEHFTEDDEEDDAMADLEGELEFDVDDELADDELDGGFDDEAVDSEADVEDAMVNVEDALDELRAAFADIMNDTDGDEIDSADEFDDDGDLEDTESFDSESEELEESATLKKHGDVKMAGDEDGKASPVKQKQKDMSDGHAKPVNFAGGDEKGTKAAAPKKMNTTGPQDQGGKFDKKVASPSNSSESAKSSIGS